MKTRLALWPALLLGLSAIAQTNPAANLLINGGFESPPGIYPYQVFSAGFGAMPGWTIESGTVEITAGTYWQSAEGAQSLDLNGIFESIGTIYQDFATVPGQTYKLRFAYAGNPECGLPTLKTANAYWNSQLLTNLSFDITGHSNTNVGWTYYEQTVTASGASSRIRFQATSPTFCGLTLDDVSVTSLSVLPSNSCVATVSDLMAWWPAEGSPDDIAGQLDGTTPHGIAYAPGVVGQAFDFNGSRRVSIPDTAALKLTNSLTIEGWVFIRNYGGFILFRGDNRPGLDPYALTVDGQGRLQFHIESLAAAVNLLTPVTSHTWQHVAATLDGESGDMRLYVNGALTAQANTTIRPFQELDSSFEPAVGIGNHGGSFHNFPFDGLIDELSIYRRALSPAEIQAINAAGNAGKCVPATPPSISVQPASQIVSLGTTTTFNVTATGTTPLNFQWQFNGNNLSGQTDSELVLTNIQLTNAGFYSVVISNGFGTITSSNALLIVNSPPDTSLCVPPPTGLVSWWRAEGNAFDAVGGNHGVLSNGAAFATGNTGEGFSFDGMSSHIRIPTSPSLNVGLGDGLTVECWIKPADLAEAQPLVEWNAGSDLGVQLWISEPWWANQGGPGSVFANITDTGGGTHALISAPGLLKTNSFQHVAVTYDKTSGSGILYLDGVIVFTANLGNFTPETSLDLLLGQRPTTSQFPATYKGVMDEVSIYNRALSQSDIQALVIAGRFGKCTSSNPPPVSAVPFIAGFNPVSATVGSAVTLTGTNFSPVAASNIVFFGAVRASVVSASVNSLTVTVPTGATYAPITLTVSGLVAYSAQPFQPTFAGGGTNEITTASFAPRFDLAGGDGAHRSVIADLDGDGKPDIAVADVYGHTISLFRNVSSSGSLSNGSFAPRVVLPAEGGASDNPYGFVVADVDGDGKPDLVACDRLANHVSVYRNLASPGSLDTNSFAPHVNFLVGADPRYARVADLDGDGRPDIVSANYAANTISILRNIGVAGSLDANSFAPAVSLPAGSGPYDIAIGDLDGDGKPDLAVVCTDGPTLSLYRNLASPGELTANSFANRVDLTALAGNLTIALGDVDADGKSDLVFGSYQSGTMSVYRNQASPGAFTTNSFASRVDFSTGHWTHTVALGDLNGDGRTDIASVGELESYLSVFQNRGVPGSFTNGSLGARVDFGAGWNAWGLSIGDLDGDGRPDLVFCNAYDDSVSIYQNVMPFTNTPPAQTNDCFPIPPGLVSWWPGEQTAADVASGNHGLLGGNATYTTGLVGAGLAFDGAGDGVNLGNPADLQLQNFTIEAWIQRGSATICSLDQDQGPGGVMLSYGYGGYGFGVFDHGELFLTEVGISYVGSPLAVTDTNYHHVAVTRSGGEVVFYLDGVPAPVAAYNPTFAFTTEVTIGAVSVDRRNSFLGRVDELAVFNRALTDSEIQAIYAAGSAGKCVVSNPPPLNPILAGPVTNSANGHWYYLLDATNWPAAEAIAVSLGGHLATINDAAENGWVFTNFSNFGEVERTLWIDLNDAVQEGNWRLISGRHASYVNWAPGEPNNGGGYFADEDHALIWNPSAAVPLGSWNDAPSNQLHHAVVEVRPLSAPGGRMRISPAALTSNNGFRLRFNGEPGQTYFIEATCDWQTWETVGVAAHLGNGQFEFVDENAWQYPGRFYRVAQ